MKNGQKTKELKMEETKRNTNKLLIVIILFV